MAMLVRTNGTMEKTAPRNGADFSLTELQEAVGGYVEMVHLTDDIVMLVDEEGKLKGRDINVAATALYGAWVGHDDIIVGDVLVCKRREVQ